MSENEERPLIFDIKRFARDDGPGIRTTVFMKGCPLACLWCHNPESIENDCEIAFYAHLCINCGECLAVCPEGAIRLESVDRVDRPKCTKCKKCVNECPALALKSIGKYYSVPELTEILKSDHFFYETSKGGVTFSGGEPTHFMDYVGEVIKGLKEDKIHVAIQTSGMFNISKFKTKLLPYLDLIYFDIKIIDPVMHKKYTGRDNSQILNNFMELVNDKIVAVIARVPLIPEITTRIENLENIADFLARTGCRNYELLAYNSEGMSKRSYTGKPIPSIIKEIKSEIKREEEWRQIFSDRFLIRSSPLMSNPLK